MKEEKAIYDCAKLKKPPSAVKEEKAAARNDNKKSRRTHDVHMYMLTI
jgi:hypothetical protein